MARSNAVLHYLLITGIKRAHTALPNDKGLIQFKFTAILQLNSL
jgi:hypothetical protein